MSVYRSFSIKVLHNATTCISECCGTYSDKFSTRSGDFDLLFIHFMYVCMYVCIHLFIMPKQHKSAGFYIIIQITIKVYHGNVIICNKY